MVNAWIEPEDEKAVSDKKNGKKVLCQKWKGLNVYAPADDEYAEILGTIVDFEWRSNSNPMTWVSVVDVEEDETEPVYVSELPDMVLAAKQRNDILLIAGESDDEIGTEFSGDVSEESSDDESEWHSGDTPQARRLDNAAESEEGDSCFCAMAMFAEI